ncbi:MAG: TIGR01212 family radical SAM protein [Clostridiales bacterium]|nr:TIGR01212 family radical SAM protein [Clostridiales bacterium]
MSGSEEDIIRSRGNNERKDTERYLSANRYYRSLFGEKVYRIALDAGCTCPNRDGTLGYGGCIFCSGSGSGEFASDRSLSIRQQLASAKSRVSAKILSGKYIAYFQNFTNTYGDEEDLNRKYEEALSDPEVVGISIATRPDCISERMYGILTELASKTHVWIELGLQTIHEKTAVWMRRGYDLSCFDKTVKRLASIDGNLDVIVHVILDLPGETKSQMLETIDHCSELPVHGIKIANLNILKGTDLAFEYEVSPFPLMERDEYIAFLGECICHLRPDIVIYRMTGDGARRSLIAPSWILDKRTVRNRITAYFREKNIVQGSYWISRRLNPS